MTMAHLTSTTPGDFSYVFNTYASGLTPDANSFSKDTFEVISPSEIKFTAVITKTLYNSEYGLTKRNFPFKCYHVQLSEKLGVATPSLPQSIIDDIELNF